MLDSDRRLHHERSIDLLRSHVTTLDSLLRVIRDSTGGFPSGHEGGGETEMCDFCKGNGSVVLELGLLESCPECGGSGWIQETFSSRTESAALREDQARKDMRRLDHIARTVRSLAEEAKDIEDFWLTTTDAKPDTEGEPCCKSCTRLPDEVQPIHRSGLCRFCYGYYLAEVEIDGVIVKPKNQPVPIEILTIRRRLMRNVTTKDWRDYWRNHGPHKSKKAS